MYCFALLSYCYTEVLCIFRPPAYCDCSWLFTFPKLQRVLRLLRGGNAALNNPHRLNAGRLIKVKVASNPGHLKSRRPRSTRIYIYSLVHMFLLLYGTLVEQCYDDCRVLSCLCVSGLMVKCLCCFPLSQLEIGRAVVYWI